MTLLVIFSFAVLPSMDWSGVGLREGLLVCFFGGNDNRGREILVEILRSQIPQWTPVDLDLPLFGISSSPLSAQPRFDAAHLFLARFDVSRRGGGGGGGACLRYVVGRGDVLLPPRISLPHGRFLIG